MCQENSDSKVAQLQQEVLAAENENSRLLAEHDCLVIAGKVCQSAESAEVVPFQASAQPAAQSTSNSTSEQPSILLLKYVANCSRSASLPMMIIMDRIHAEACYINSVRLM